MLYALITLILYISLLCYFYIADKNNIVDKPNLRSSHSQITLRGGGIIYLVAALLYFLKHIETSYLFFIGISLVGIISFVDDIRSLPNRLRVSVQVLGMSLLFLSIGLFSIGEVYIILIAYILAIGIINAYNFMDGINGMNGLYTLSCLGCLLYINLNIIHFTDSDLIIYPILASLVFLFFNFRKKAKCFAGDVGSISAAFWLIFLLFELMIKSHSPYWLGLLAIYGVDTCCTIIHRLILKQNIFQAHRLHLFQVLSNEYKMDQRLVSLIYALVQIGVSCLIIFLYQSPYLGLISALVLLFLMALYLVKFLILRTSKS